MHPGLRRETGTPVATGTGRGSGYALLSLFHGGKFYRDRAQGEARPSALKIADIARRRQASRAGKRAYAYHVRVQAGRNGPPVSCTDTCGHMADFYKSEGEGLHAGRARLGSFIPGDKQQNANLVQNYVEVHREGQKSWTTTFRRCWAVRIQLVGHRQLLPEW